MEPNERYGAALSMDVVIDTVSDLRRHLPRLVDAWIVGLDLRDVDVVWSEVQLRGAAFAGCVLSAGAETQVRAAGATVLPPLDGFEFEPYRSSLYDHAELMAGYVPGQPETTLDARIGRRTREPASPLETMARGIHDSSIDAALVRYLHDTDGRVVGIMGSHETLRTAPEYRQVAELARRLTTAGFFVATGGGPGLMEAANLGAWLATAPDDALDAALGCLAASPSYDADPAGYLTCALEVRERWPDGADSLGVPTWLYVDEPLNQFSTCIAKYFQNSIRENGLLAIALGGIVYTPGGSGTAQEIFTDAAQNDYTLYDIRSPMVFLGVQHYEHDHPGLVDALRDLAVHGGWADLVRVVDSTDDALAAISELVHPDVRPHARALRKR